MHSVAILHTYIIESEMQDLEKTSCLRVSCFVLTLSCHDLLNNFASLCRRALSHKKKKALIFPSSISKGTKRVLVPSLPRRRHDISGI